MEKPVQLGRTLIAFIFMIAFSSCNSVSYKEIESNKEEYKSIFDYIKQNNSRLEVSFSESKEKYLEFYYENNQRKSRPYNDMVLIQKFIKNKISSVEYIPSENMIQLEFESASFIQKRPFLVECINNEKCVEFKDNKKVDKNIYFYYRKSNRY